MLQIGDKAPSFSLPISSGGELDFGSLQGKKVVLYFYPKDGGYVEVSCYHTTDKLYKEHGWKDGLVVNIGTEEFSTFLTEEYYKHLK